MCPPIPVHPGLIPSVSSSSLINSHSVLTNGDSQQGVYSALTFNILAKISRVREKQFKAMGDGHSSIG